MVTRVKGATASDATEVDMQNGETVEDAVNQRTIYVGSVAELEALNSSNLPDGQQVSVREYYEGTDVGGGIFYWDASNTETEDRGVVFGAGTSGRWVRSETTVIDPYSFGALSEVDDQERIIEDFFAFCHANRQGSYNVCARGEFRVGTPVVVEQCQRVSFLSGRLVILPSSHLNSPIECGLKLGAFNDNTMDNLNVSGGSASNKMFYHGIICTYIRGTVINKLNVSYVRGVGVAVTSSSSQEVLPGFSNNNTWAIGDIWFRDCGEKVTNISFSETGRAPSTTDSDSSTLSVNLDEFYEFSTISRGLVVKIDSEYFSILSYNSAANEATIFPSLNLIQDNSLVSSGTMTVFAGGGLLTEGGDSGQGRVSSVNCRDSVTALMLQSAYGGRYGGLTSQFNHFAIMYGRPPSSVASGNYVDNMYFEGEFELRILKLGDNASITLNTAMSEIGTWYSLIASELTTVNRSAANGGVSLLGQIGSFADRGNHGGHPRTLAWKRGYENGGLTLPYPDIMAKPGGTLIVSPDNASRAFGFNLNPDLDGPKAYGPSGLYCICIGFSATNDIDIFAPAGETIEGASSIKLNGLPANFILTAGGPPNWTAMVIELPSASPYIV